MIIFMPPFVLMVWLLLNLQKPFLICSLQNIWINTMYTLKENLTTASSSISSLASYFNFFPFLVLKRNPCPVQSKTWQEATKKKTLKSFAESFHYVLWRQSMALGPYTSCVLCDHLEFNGEKQRAIIQSVEVKKKDWDM